MTKTQYLAGLSDEKLARIAKFDLDVPGVAEWWKGLTRDQRIDLAADEVEDEPEQ